MKPDAVAIIGGIMILIAIYVLWRAHRSRSSAINLADLLLDSTYHPPRVTLAKFIGFGGWLASTYWISYVVASGKYDPTSLIIGYIGVCLAAKVATDVVNARSEDDKTTGRPTL